MFRDLGEMNTSTGVYCMVQLFSPQIWVSIILYDVPFTQPPWADHLFFRGYILTLFGQSPIRLRVTYLTPLGWYDFYVHFLWRAH